MKKLLVFALVLVVAVGALGYWREWFSVSQQGAQVDTEKFKQDKAAFSKTVGEKAKAMKDQVSSLWNKSEALSADDKTHMQTELGALNKQHERLEQQIQELDNSGQDRFESIQQDLSKSLGEVEKKIADLTKKLENAKEK